jgi:hypothetical protein
MGRHFLRPMALNRSEQALLDYWQANPEEQRFWRERLESRRYFDTAVLESELWDYFVERSGQVEPFRGWAAREGLRRESLRNLAEHLWQIWSPAAAGPRRAD